MTTQQLWTIEQVCSFFQVGRSTAYKSIITRPDFPAAIKIEGGPKRYVPEEVAQWAERQRQK